MMHDIGVFVFRRDLRLVDNHGLIELGKACKKVLPVFLLDKHQVVRGEHNQYYHSNNAVQFMCESLVDLDRQLAEQGSRLRLFFGDPAEQLARLLDQLDGSVVVGWNADYSRYSLQRDEKMQQACRKHGAEVLITHTDLTLRPFKDLVRDNGEGFKQYGAFYKHAIRKPPLAPTNNSVSSWVQRRAMKLHGEYDISDLSKLHQINQHLAQRGGRTEALLRLQRLRQFRDYDELRDIPAHNTTNLSAAINFGCVSVREVLKHVVKALGSNSTLVKQLYWRDFYLQALRYVPNAGDYKKHIDRRFEKIAWKNKTKDWERLWEARTGFLLIDAGMMEMRTTGFLHNRLRMLLGVFWTKYLMIDSMHPKLGSQVGYSRLLVDAVGPSQNLMNHRWILDFDMPGRRYAPSGAPLSGRPMDVSNKMIKKWDPKCVYVKKWLPHLKDVPVKDLVNWDADLAKKHGKVHPAPMFDAKERYDEWVEACKGL
jgi:deoxyribodipyrimidine photo-lyase